MAAAPGSIQRVHSIAEMAEFAKEPIAPNKRTIKDWLRTADALRTIGIQANKDGNLEAAFLYLARSATMYASRAKLRTSMRR